MIALKNYIDDFLCLFFPHTCIGCNKDVLSDENILCAACLNELPVTGFIAAAQNPIEKLFYGRLNIEHAGSAFYFYKDAVIKQVIVQLKYRNNLAAGIFLGKLLGLQLAESKRFDDVDIIVPMPLNDKKLFKRGYNQTTSIVNGIASVWNKPVVEDAVKRVMFTETQTHKNRIARWQTMQGSFSITAPGLLQNKHVLLVDDIVTTGATFEACGSSILQVPDAKLSVASVAYTI